MEGLKLIHVEVGVEAGERWVEEIHLTSLGGQRYRVEEHMILNEELGICDEIEGELESGNCLRKVRIVHRAGWKRYGIMLPRDFVESGKVRSLGATIESHGGRWDIAFGGVFAASMPPGSEFDPMVEVRRRADESSGEGQ